MQTSMYRKRTKNLLYFVRALNVVISVTMHAYKTIYLRCMVSVFTTTNIQNFNKI